MNGFFVNDSKQDVNATITGSLANIKGAVVNVTTAGESVRLPDIPCNTVTITALRDNTGFIYISVVLTFPLQYLEMIWHLKKASLSK